MKALLLFAIVPLFFIPMAFTEQVTVDIPFMVFEQTYDTYHDPDREGIEIMRCWFVNQKMEYDYQPTQLVPVDTTTVEVEVVAPEPEEPKQATIVIAVVDV